MGSYVQLFPFRAKGVYSYHSHPIYDPSVWYDPLIMMLIGMAFLKLGVLTGSYPTNCYVWMALLSFAVGLPAHLWSVWWPIRQQLAIDAWYSTGVAFQFGRFTALGYVAVIILAIKSGVLRGPTRTLAYVGQVAFSNYILTSLICTTIFEGYGFATLRQAPALPALRNRPLRLAGDSHRESAMAAPIPLRPSRMGVALPHLLEETTLPSGVPIADIDIGYSVAKVRRRTIKGLMIGDPVVSDVA